MAQELLAFSVLGVIAGLLGSGFVALHRLILLHKRERYAYTGTIGVTFHFIYPLISLGFPLVKRG